jgi:hypothetical protein
VPLKKRHGEPRFDGALRGKNFQFAGRKVRWGIDRRCCSRFSIYTNSFCGGGRRIPHRRRICICLNTAPAA